MKTWIVVDTSIIINAYSNPGENNPYWDFLEDFKRNNQRQPKMQICIDQASVIHREYEQALSTKYGEGILINFNQWFEATGILQAISSEDGFISELGNHKDPLEQRCEGKGLVFIARAFHNRRKQNKGIIVVADQCDMDEYRKPFFNREIRDYLWDNMRIKIATIENIPNEIKDIWDKDHIPLVLWDKIYATFSNEELDDLSFSIGLDPPPGTMMRRARIRQFVGDCERRGLLFDLINCCCKERPKEEWPELLT